MEYIKIFFDYRARYILLAVIFLVSYMMKNKNYGEEFKGCLFIIFTGDFVWLFIRAVFGELFYSLWAGGFCIVMSLRMIYLSAKRGFIVMLPAVLYLAVIACMFYDNVGKYLFREV